MSNKAKSSSEVELDIIVEKEAKKAPAKPVKKEMKVGDISKCGKWAVKSIGKYVDMVPAKPNNGVLGVATKTIADAEAMMV